MKSAILDDQESYFSYLAMVFKAIDNEQLNYNWLITDCVCYPKNEDFEELFSQEYIWLTGEQLTEIIEEEDIQFIWGVFSGFAKDICFSDVIKFDYPFADGYRGFWVNEVGIQHKLADIEIVAWDSTFTLHK